MNLAWSTQTRRRTLPQHSRSWRDGDRCFRLFGTRRGKSRPGTLMLVVMLALAGLLLLLQLRREQGPGAQKLSDLGMDIIGVALKPTCVNRQAVHALNRLWAPRYIHIVTSGPPMACTIFESFAPNVICHDEDTLIPGINKVSVGAYLERRFLSDPDKRYMGRSLTGWYLQQMVKLGAGRHVRGLSQHYIIWDLDMILLSALPPPVLVGGDGMIERTILNVGGARIRQQNLGYATTYRNLTGRALENAPDGTSFVTHWMVVYKPYMEEFLRAISDSQEPDAVYWRILDAVDERWLLLGFSEYASYASWVLQQHHDSVAVAQWKTWRRQPLGGQLTLKLLRFLHPRGLCCPHRSVLTLMWLLGYQYTGFELGHVPSCQLAANETTYGVSLPGLFRAAPFRHAVGIA